MLIGFLGYKGSGKTLAAQALAEMGYTVHSLAAPIKAAMRALGLTDEDMAPARKELPLPFLCGCSPRYAMQTLGTEWGRNIIGQDLWLHTWQATRPDGPIVMDDVRFANEATYARKLGAKLIRIVRPGLKSIDMHPSEREQSQIEVDDTIFNIGDERTFGIMVRETVASHVR